MSESLLNKKQKTSVDYFLLIIVSFLLVWGMVTIATTSFPLSLQKYNTPWVYIQHQLIMLILGISAGVFAYKIKIETLKKYAFYLFLFNLFLLFLVFVPKIGVKIGGAKRWLNIGGFLFQPSELLKISFLIYLAAWISNKKTKIKEPTKKFFIPFIIILTVLVFGLILQPDMTTLEIILLTGIIMYFSIQTPLWHSIILLVLLLIGGLALIKIAPYRMARFVVFLNPDIDPLGLGYQLNQAMIAIGSGKILGIGEGFSLGMSRQKFGFLPHPISDSIFAIVSEELGFIGATLLILVFLVFCWRGLKIAKSAPDTFTSLLAIGITSWITLQFLFNAGGIVGVMPLGGVPLPFFSYGGSHLITELAALGILFNISKYRNSR